MSFLPLAAAGLAMSSLLAVLFLVWRFQQALRSSAIREDQMRDRHTAALSALGRDLAELKERTSELESDLRDSPGSAAVRPGMNLNKRTEALRQHRLGQGAEMIARTVEMNKAEVELLLKLERLHSPRN